MKPLLVFAALLLLAACATTQKTAQNSDVPVQKTYRTGSNLPVRDNEVPNVQSSKANVIMSAPAPYVPDKASN
jgi:uncharacterized lipoprotein YmbA